MNSALDDVTLQINLSPGDVNYAEQIVPKIVSNHNNIENRILIVDCCRPQKTRLINPDVRFPLNVFNKNLARIKAIAEKLLADKIVTHIYYLTPDDPIIGHLSKKYLNKLYQSTHAAGGTANMSYWAAIELCTTRYLLHYDGDIFLYQEKGYDWVQEAKSLMEKDNKIVISVPRLCPPPTLNIPSLHEGRPFKEYQSYWLNDWFSTRQFLLDKRKFETYLPLPVGKIKFKLLLRKYLKRAFPIDPEILLFNSIGGRGGKRLVLKSTKAWIIHPLQKNDEFLKILPQILLSVEKGIFPLEQQGHEDILHDKWLLFIAELNENRETRGS